MEYADQLGKDPFCHVEYADSVHVVWINIAADMTYIPVIADLVQSDQHPWQLNADRSAPRRRFLLHLQTCVVEVRWLVLFRRETTVNVTTQNTICDLTELAAVEFGRLPSSFAKIPLDFAKFLK